MAVASQLPLPWGQLPAYPNYKLKTNRYTILRKLGEGVSATTWLVHDPQGLPQESYLAVKILTVEATKMHEAGTTKELEIMKELKDMEDREFLSLIYDDFFECSPFGSHLCIVMSLYSSSVSALRRSSPTKALPPYMARTIIHMLVEALDQLHERRIVHTGNGEDEFELEGKFYPILKGQPIPHQYTWNTSAFEAEKMIVYLIDFSHAQRTGEQPTANCSAAPALRAPETILWSDFGPGTFELLVGRWLFEPEEGEDWGTDDDHLAKMMELTGQRFPHSMLERSKRRSQCFDDNSGNLLRIQELIPSSLETAMANYKIPGLEEEEINRAADFIRACLRFDYKGIGEAIALRLAKDGLDVAVNDISGNQENVTAVSEKIAALGRKTSVHIADVSVEDQVKKMIEGVVESHGGLDVMVANAGIVLVKPMMETEVEEWDRIFSINVRGVFLCYKYAAGQMIAQGRGGRILGASSLAGKRSGSPNYSAYCGTKFAVRGITQAAAVELGRHGITVNAYAPGVIESPMTQYMDQATQKLSNTAPGQLFDEFAKRTLVGYNGKPDDVASLVSYLASKEAHFITGQSVSINGGVFCD
ncbi:hypothetical protein VKT23_013106 [Stygiomarasmius scandens]|uniref:Protein kinase domain-containing protein n=1 Tax=Marasmiellus scandens TaxID=2682957 RepID=A0ABR1J3P7_9AGAR